MRERLGGVVEPTVLSDVELLVSELATNSVRHGGAGEEDPLRLELAVAPGAWVRVRWCDEGPGFAGALPGPQVERGGGGFGLVLLEHLASRWGIDREEAFCVWFELDLARGGSS